MSERKVVHYDEAQVNRWLAWLAHTMQRHDQTVFLIENLQPSWLQTRGEVRTFSVLTRMMWGAWAALVFGLAAGVISGGIDGQIPVLMVGLLFGLVFGLIFGFGDVRKLYHRPSMEDEAVVPSSWTFVISVLRVCLNVQLIIVLLGVFFAVMTGGLQDTLIFTLRFGVLFGLILGLPLGLVYASRSRFRTATTAIHTVETVAWAGAVAVRSGAQGLIVGVIAGLLFGVGAASFGGVGSLLSDLSIPILFFAPLFAVIFGVIGGFRPVMKELKTETNQGIWLSMRNALRIGVIGGLLVGLLMWGRGSITFGLLAAIALGGWFGGIDVVEHAVLRLLLARKGYAPLNYARFLDYAAAELNFLQKVGGGYMFIHRYLLEYFAGMYEPIDPALKPSQSGNGAHGEHTKESGGPVTLPQ